MANKNEVVTCPECLQRSSTGSAMKDWEYARAPLEAILSDFRKKLDEYKRKYEPYERNEAQSSV